MDRARNSFGTPGMGGKRRRAVAAGGRECRPGGRSLHDRVREWGKETCHQRVEDGGR